MKDYKEPEMDVVVAADEELNNVNGGVQLGSSCRRDYWLPNEELNNVNGGVQLGSSCRRDYWLPNEEQGAQ